MSEAGQGISPGGLLAVVWSLAGVSTLLMAGRFIIRSSILRRLYLDDLFSTLAWLLMIVALILLTISNSLSYQATSILIGETPMPPPDELADITIRLRKWAVAQQTLFWTSIYCVKLSFMWLYKLILGNSSIWYHRTWYIALVYVILSYGICLIGVYGQCGDARNLWTTTECMSPYVAALQAKLIWVAWFFNVSSDIVVICLPMPFIWRLLIRPSQKLAVSAIFSLATVTIAFETVRSVKLYQQSALLTNLYSYLELEVAVIISILPSYRFLISSSEKNQEHRRMFWDPISLRGRHSDRSSSSPQVSDGNRSRGVELSRVGTSTSMNSEEQPPLRKPSISGTSHGSQSVDL